jgi:hypothetical protein
MNSHQKMRKKVLVSNMPTLSARVRLTRCGITDEHAIVYPSKTYGFGLFSY